LRTGSAPSRRNPLTSFPNGRELSPVNGAIQEGSDAVITPATMLSQIAATSPSVTKAWADTGYRTKAIDHGARLGLDVEVVQRDPGVEGFKVIPRRWVVERTFG
jgi:hypothetical protein